MALRDQPYLPLYVQDFLTDEKLNECSAESTGVYIRIMCIMHKSEPYGTICLNDKYKQISGNHAGNGGSKTSGDIKGFAAKLFRQMPYELATIENAITELVSEGVMQIEGDYLMQKRMVKDGRLSLIRAESGRKGGEAKRDADAAKGFANALANEFATAKSVASTESEIEYESDNENDVLKEGFQGEKKPDSIEVRFNALWLLYPSKVGKKGALVAYRKALKAGVTDEVIADGIKKYAAFLKSKPDRPPLNGSTYFNGARWEDEMFSDTSAQHDDNVVWGERG